MKLAEAHILLVDDQPAVRLTLAMVLSRHGAHVTQAANGAEAFSATQCESFDLLLTDRHMPVMDGAALLHALKASGQHIPAVVCAGTLSLENEPEYPAVAATLLKPFTPGELIATVEAILAPLSPRNSRT